jgi:hypothetical protein
VHLRRLDEGETFGNNIAVGSTGPVKYIYTLYNAMDLAQETIDRIGQPESELLEYKALLRPRPSRNSSARSPTPREEPSYSALSKTAKA